MTVRRSHLDGRHWAKEDGGRVHFVSRALAERLHSLLPPHVHLVPINLDPGGSIELRGRQRPRLRAAARHPEIDPDISALLAASIWDNGAGQQHQQGIQLAVDRLRLRIAASSTMQLFQFIDAAVVHDVPLEHNKGLGACILECDNRGRDEIIPYAQLWLSDSDPIRRINAVSILSIAQRRGGGPDARTKALLLQALDEHDPFVLAGTIFRLTYTDDNDYYHELEKRKVEFASHSDVRVRDSYAWHLGRMAASARWPNRLRRWFRWFRWR